ncbi:hypothetical protein CLAFUR4_20116 [Fulvia fulva]|nr:hypothetical protein CLAFUR4_20116 [Fulvia fulva]WPV26299.1 hypothetical protein CLAFUW7_20115 [Fulvia fulva]
MAFLTSLALLQAIQLATAAPAPVFEISKRQDPSGTVDACKGSDCADCPLYFSTGTGYPECTYYDTQQLKDKGYPSDENGMVDVFFSAPPLVDNTFLIQFCCGTSDCTAAGAPTKRSPNPANAGLGKRGLSTLLLHDRNGTVIEPQTFAPTAVKERTIQKRDCGGFTATNGPYTKAGPISIILDEVTCGPTESCSATESKTVEQSFSVDVGVSVGDPFGIISASIGITWEKSISRSFSAQYMFGAGETGYVTFIPILTCVDVYYTGDCDDSGKQITACAASSSGGAMAGDIRGVVVRGA